MKLTTRSPVRDFALALEHEESFRTHGNLHGECTSTPYSGRLPDEYRAALRDAHYVVYSYSTPIAWAWYDAANQRHWAFPDEKYSLTTSRHQTKIRRALHYIGVDIGPTCYDEECCDR